MAFGLGFKLNTLPTFVVNPYLFGEANFNLYYREIFQEYNEPQYNSGSGTWENGQFETKNNPRIGGLGGLGFDLNFTNNFTIFIQGGVSYLGPYDTNFEGSRNILDVHAVGGIRISLFKSKII